MWHWAKCKCVIQVGKSLLLDFGLATYTKQMKPITQSDWHKGRLGTFSMNPNLLFYQNLTHPKL